jgi:heme/copper-type cytochrome/quinol oxidase subunit 2
MEPFYQLATIGGASARHSLLTEHLASGVTMDSLAAIFSGPYVLGFSTLIYLLMSLMVTLVSESMTVKPTSYCVQKVSSSQPCNPAWVINLPVTHVLQALLVIVIVAIAAMAFINLRRRSGVESDPSCLASVISLLGDRVLMEDLQSIHLQADRKHVTYALDFYSMIPGLQKYGIVKTSSHMVSGEAFVQRDTGYTAVQNPAASTHTKARQSINTSTTIDSVILLVLIFGLFGMILGYRITTDDFGGFNTFMNDNNFGPRFLLSGAAVIIGFGIKRIEHDIRIMEIYRGMNQSPQPAKRSVLASMMQTTYSNVFVAMRRGQWFAAFIALVTISSEILTVAVSGIPASTSQIPQAYRACTNVSLVILAVMATAVILVLFRSRSDPDLPRNPDTLAHTLLYLCGSNMLQQPRALDENHQENTTRKTRSRYDGRLFDFGWATGVDGRTRWTVKEVINHEK